MFILVTAHVKVVWEQTEMLLLMSGEEPIVAVTSVAWENYNPNDNVGQMARERLGGINKRPKHVFRCLENCVNSI